jgi:pyruvate,water dikinase
MNENKLIYWFEEIGKEFNDIVGKKCANLGEMTRMGLPVPRGFAIGLDMYRKFLEETSPGDKLARYICECGDLKGKSLSVIEEISRNIRALIERCSMPNSMESEICARYEELCNKCKINNMPVSVRSAGTQSRPGMFETYLNVSGKDEVLEKVKMVWASTFTPRAIAFRISKGLPIDCDMLGVAVVKMVNARAAGIGFTIDPVIGDDSKVIIEANWGLGEGVVSGVENVDRWTVDKQTLKIVERSIGKKIKYVVNMEKGADWAEVPPGKQNKPCLSDKEIKAVAEVAILLEQRLGQPQDMEWAVDPDFPTGKNIFLLQTRPAKSVAKKAASESKELADRLVSEIRSVDLSQAAEKLKNIEFKF